MMNVHVHPVSSIQIYLHAVKSKLFPLQVALSDLKTNPKISSLLAYFVNFVASGVSRINFNQLFNISSFNFFHEQFF